MDRLHDKVAIITGAAGGQGKVALELFATEGARVVGADLLEKPDEELAGLLDKYPDQLCYLKGDMTDEGDVHRLVDFTMERFGRIDVLYNNHGMMVGKPFLESTMADFDKVIEGNLRSVFMLSLHCAKRMAETGGGSIIHVSSVGGLVGFPGMAAYGASKGGVAQLARSMATDLAPHRIRVNAICPGVIDTPMPRRYLRDAGTAPDDPAAWEAFANMHLLKRIGRPEEVVWLAVYLASDEASFMTGAVIPIDGGLTAI